VVVLLVAVNVFSGGMRSITVVQAFQYWVKLFALAIPTFVLLAVFVGGHLNQRPLSATSPPNFTEPDTIKVTTPVVLTTSQSVWLTAHGWVDNFDSEGRTYWGAGTQHQVNAGTLLSFPAGAPVPTIVGTPTTNADWWRRQSGGTGSLLSTYSLIIALFLGTMGLPHVLVRFYTNPNGRAARRTTLHVLLLLGLFYAFPTVLGALSRLYVPELLATGQTDAAVLLLPGKMLPGLPGQILGAVIVAGAFAA